MYIPSRNNRYLSDPATRKSLELPNLPDPLHGGSIAVVLEVVRLVIAIQEGMVRVIKRSRWARRGDALRRLRPGGMFWEVCCRGDCLTSQLSTCGIYWPQPARTISVTQLKRWV